jgi:L-2,4-diaminobutyric acid acetyltransferase
MCGNDILLRKPTGEDGFPIHELIRRSPPLDLNSTYCYALIGKHFADTSMVAELDNEIVGFISAYIPPGRDDTIFIWQVAVDEKTRGQGLAKLMLFSLLERPECSQVRYLETTVSPSNSASRRLFERLATENGVSVQESEFLAEEDFGDQQHESEPLLRVGPLNNTIQ